MSFLDKQEHKLLQDLYYEQNSCHNNEGMGKSSQDIYKVTVIITKNILILKLEKF